MITNYDRTKSVIASLVGRQFTSCEYAIIMYLLYQQFSFGDVKGIRGDSSSYSYIAQATGYHRRQVIYAIKQLTIKHVISKLTSPKKHGNLYKFIP